MHVSAHAQPTEEALKDAPRISGRKRPQASLMNLFSSLISAQKSLKGGENANGVLSNNGKGTDLSAEARNLKSARLKSTLRPDIASKPLLTKLETKSSFAGDSTQILNAKSTLGAFGLPTREEADSPASRWRTSFAASKDIESESLRGKGRRNGAAGESAQDLLAANNALFAGALSGLHRQPVKSNDLQAGEEAGPSNRNSLRAKREKRLEIEVTDLRTAALPASGASADAVRPLGSGSDAALGAIDVRLRSAADDASFGSLREQSGPQGGKNFSELLARELREVYNADIVKQASIVLRNDNAGIIRLTLHPETLGNVKIRLDLADNKIAGMIQVESEEALRAFEKEIASLEQAFKDGGFDGASIELAVNADASGRDGARQELEQGKSPFFSSRFAADTYQEGVVDVDLAAWAGAGADLAVNELA